MVRGKMRDDGCCVVLLVKSSSDEMDLAPRTSSSESMQYMVTELPLTGVLFVERCDSYLRTRYGAARPLNRASTYIGEASPRRMQSGSRITTTLSIYNYTSLLDQNTFVLSLLSSCVNRDSSSLKTFTEITFLLLSDPSDIHFYF